MLEINCPWCGPRDQVEFTCGGEAHIVRPDEPEKLTDSELTEISKLQNQLSDHIEKREISID